MGFFDKLDQQQSQGREISMDEMRGEIGNIKANPSSYLKERGFNIPEGMTDPRAITRHLLQSGQVNGGRLQQVMRGLGMPGGMPGRR